MAKVQFNCRLNESTVDAINEERERLSNEEGRAVSQAEVLERIVPTHSFTRFRDILEPVVYGWRRGEQYLYIGYSKNGLRRACESDHHVIGKVEAVGDHDVLDLWVCKTPVEARNLEREMIGQHQPEYNKAIPATADGQLSTKLTNFRLHYDSVATLEGLADYWQCSLTDALLRSLVIAESAVLAVLESVEIPVCESEKAAPVTVPKTKPRSTEAKRRREP